MTAKVVKIRHEMPKDCCGMCVFAQHVATEDYFLCMANPPFPIVDVQDDGITWARGAAVEFTDPRCWFYTPIGRT